MVAVMRICVLAWLGIVSNAGWATGADEPPAEFAPPVLETARLGDLAGMIAALAERRVIFIGETHDRYEDHLLQWAIIAGLHARGLPLMIGVECFQQPFQAALDDYSAGRIDEAELLRRTEYFTRWGFDYRLYRPLLRFARRHHIPLLALNLEREFTDRIAQVGIAGLSAAERARLPADLDRGDAAYRSHLQQIFAQHPQKPGADFERFLDVQVAWDEGMAARAVAALRAAPERRLIVLAGVGHIEQGRGIPRRVQRHLALPAATVINGMGRAITPDVADFLVFAAPVTLPASGMLGVVLDPKDPGDGVAIREFAPESGARAAGLQVGDRVVRLEDQPIADETALRLALLDTAPGQTLTVEVLRPAASNERLRFSVKLR